MLIKLNINSSKVYYKNKCVRLTEYEYRMFTYLMNNACVTIDYNVLVNDIWNGRTGGVTLNAVSQLAYRLRDKMRMIGAPLTIKISSSNGCEIKCHKKMLFIIKGKSAFRFKLKAML
jgi:DNA-binding response OmpR family regulator